MNIIDSTQQRRLNHPDLSVGLAEPGYLRERIRPSVTDVNYLSFADLLETMRRFAEQAEGSLFDYGCGGTPYRSLFGKCKSYTGADVTPGPKVDRLLSTDGLTTEEAGTYDLILSSQVLEHVKYPAVYLRECHRILKSGGRLFASTHGMFQEHGCPFDFQRWTSSGLEELMRTNGFKVLESSKLTTEIRGLIQLQHHFMDHLRCPHRQLLRHPFAIARKLYQWLLVPPFNWIGKQFPEQGVVPASHPTTLYVGISVLVQKP